MTTKAESSPAVLDWVMGLLVLLLLASSIVGYYYYADLSVLLRAGVFMAALAISIAIGFQTVWGRQLWRFIQSSRIEMRKVVWPTRQETVQTTLTVLVFVLIMGVFFWLLDMGLLSLTKFLTGQGG